MTNAKERKGQIFGVPPGADFVLELFKRLHTLADNQPPEFMPRINVLVPSRRMQRRLKGLFEQKGSYLLPKIGLVTDVSHLLTTTATTNVSNRLARLLDLKAVVGKLAEVDPRLSPSGVIDLASSLSDILDEMQGEGVSFDDIDNLPIDDQSGHWEQSLAFIRAIRAYIETRAENTMDAEAALRQSIETLTNQWSVAPPTHPVLVAGSTGSRATTRMLMSAVAKLDGGEVLLPGFDHDTPDDIWARLMADRRHEDHPQFRFAKFLVGLGATPKHVAQLGTPPQASRNRLISLALRPAPVTDQWLRDGPALGHLTDLTEHLTLIEARDVKSEALAIALAACSEIHEGRTVALIAPDATLARRITAELSRWKIVPDDSGGTPLGLSPAGRFARQTARLAGGDIGPVELIALLKHPLTRFGEDRGPFMRITQEFELFLRRRRVLAVSQHDIEAFAAQHPEFPDWTNWLTEALTQASRAAEPTLFSTLRHHRDVLCAFAGKRDLETVFQGDDGAKVTQVFQAFAALETDATAITVREYQQLLERALAAESVRAQIAVRPDVMIWGTLEARVQGAETVFLCGLNEGTWPEQPQADPWLNRAMRREAGLLLPERQIGLAGHDFQQAVCAKRVFLTRSARIEGTESVPSRWLGRLMNLLSGLKETAGDAALQAMQRRGQRYIDFADHLDEPTGNVTPARRPAPAPPLANRPSEFSVTEIERLIRDPYAVYARRILKLSPLDPLSPVMDARLKGTALHKVLEQAFAPDKPLGEFELARKEFLAIAETVLATVPDVIARTEWLAQLKANFPWLYAGEYKRREQGAMVAKEIKGRLQLPDSPLVLKGKADRIDRFAGGGLIIYDYKTGTPPSAKTMKLYDRQMVLEAIMAEHGAFAEIPVETVRNVTHLGVGRTPVEQTTKLEGENETVTNIGYLRDFLTNFIDPSHGFMSRRAMETLRYDGDYDHLARFGEWDETEDPEVTPVP